MVNYIARGNQAQGALVACESLNLRVQYVQRWRNWTPPRSLALQ